MGLRARLKNPFRKSDRRALLDEQQMRLFLAFALSAESSCIDVGASEGTVLREIVRLAPRGHHIAYEPLPDFHARLVEDFPTVDVRRVALSNTDGEASFKYVRNLVGYSGLRERAYPRRADISTITVRTQRLDGNLPAGYLPTLIKIDVEGGERLVIEGAMETLTNHRPIVIFEFGKGAADFYGTHPNDLYHPLCRQAGLRIFDLDGGGPYTLPQFESSYESGERWNYVAHR